MTDSRTLTALAAEFLRQEVMPALSGNLAFQTRVAAGALELVARRMALEEQAMSAERARLTGLLGVDGDLTALNRTLCADIRARRIDLSDQGLVHHLRRTLLNRMAIDQPNYAAARRAAQVWVGD